MIKERNIALCIVLSIITCGIYGIVWYVMMTDDIRNLRNGKTVSGGEALLYTIITCGIYSIYWNYKMPKELYESRIEKGEIASDDSILCLILSLLGFGIISWCVIQNDLNKLAQNN